MSDNIFDLIKAEVPIWDLLEETTGLKFPIRTRNLKVSCPFHGDDNRKSGFVYHDTDSFRCFTCNQSWDQIAFWAQANEWWKVNEKGEDVLDMGKAIASLKEKYNLEYVAPSWEQKYRQLKGTVEPDKGFSDYPLKDREKLFHFYQWKVLQRLARLPKEGRQGNWEQVMTLWDELEDLDLEQPRWKEDLNVWRDRATLVV